MVGDAERADTAVGAPQGVATFLFSDVEGSTATLARLSGDAYAQVLAEQQR